MFGFPINLQSNDIQKFTNNADSGFPKPGIREVFYSIKDGNWNDITVWQTASGRVGKLPTGTDDVYVRHSIRTNIPANTSISVNNLFINKIGFLTLTGGGGSVGLIINGNLQSLGTIDQNNGQNSNLVLNGVNNLITNFLTTITNSVTYGGAAEQTILNLPYGNLYLSGGNSNKILLFDLVVNNILNITSAILDLGIYNLQVNGITQINSGLLKKTNSGTVTFGGLLQVDGFFGFGGIDFTGGNPTVEVRNGIRWNTFNGTWLTGLGTWNATTNTQTWEATNSQPSTRTYDAPIVINEITLNINSIIPLLLNNTINGAGGSSVLINRGNLYFATQLSAENSMTTGIFDITTFANTVGYAGNYSTTIPVALTNFHSLAIGGTGTKTLGADTTLNGNLVVSTNGSLQLSTFDLSVGTTTTINSGCSLLKSGAGNVLFIGQLIVNTISGIVIDFSGGNPTVELRNGIFLNQSAVTAVNSGTGQWSFTTNSQTITNNNGAGSQAAITFNCPLLISGAITVTIISTGGSRVQVNINQPFNGDNAASTLSNQGVINFTTLASVSCMTTGVFDHSPTTANTFAGLSYGFNGDYTIPYATMNSLTISGTGTKTLGVNTILNKSLAINPGATLDLASYNLTVTGNAIGSGLLLKTGSGDILFIGNVNITNVNLLGNPNVEFRGGYQYNQGGTLNTGTGTWTFSTNNQNIIYPNNGNISITLDCNILISGAIILTVTNTASGVLTWILTKSIDGNNVSSTLRMGTGSPTINYKSATQPMATGVLDTSTNLNTWIYGLNNQDIKGSPTISPKQVYRNLTLNGTGTKTLQGYVSVLNTYTLTAPATLALNGFTLTNP